MDAMGQFKKLMCILPHIEVEMMREGITIEESSRKRFDYRWGWMVEEYRELERKLEKYSEKADIQLKYIKEEGKTIFPVPSTVNGEYGWLGSKPKFKLERYGPDVLGLRKIEEKNRIGYN